MRTGWDDTFKLAEAAVTDLGERPVFALDDLDLDQAVGRVDRLLSRLAGVAAILIREAEARALPGSFGYTSVGVWLRERHRMSHSRSRQLLSMGRALTSRPALQRAVSEGQISTEQAGVISAAIESLIPRVSPEIVDKAESALIGHAEEFHPSALAALGERILGHVAPEIAEEQDAAHLARLERRAQETRSLTLTAERATGRTRIAGWLPADAAAFLNAALDPLSKPDPTCGQASVTGPGSACGQASACADAAISRDATMANGRESAGTPMAPGPTDSAPRDPRSPAQRRADALIDMCRLALAAGDLPVSGGQRPQLVVTIDYQTLARQAGPGLLDDGRSITPETVRQIACDAAVIPAVLGSRGEVLDLGRAARTWTGPARRALIVRDRGCAFPGCDRPASWCDAHHIRHWADGGPTDLDNGVLLCGYHHRLIHHTAWQVRMGGDRRPEFIPPPEIDPLGRPRRNPYHQRE